MRNVISYTVGLRSLNNLNINSFRVLQRVTMVTLWIRFNCVTLQGSTSELLLLAGHCVTRNVTALRVILYHRLRNKYKNEKQTCILFNTTCLTKDEHDAICSFVVESKIPNTSLLLLLINNTWNAMLSNVK